MTEFKNGDTVRITFEGEWKEGAVVVNNRWHFGPAFQDDATLEKVEPPVETFKPGDVVRSTRIPKYIYALAKGGYTDLFNGIWVPSSEIFRSDYYEKVSIE